MKFSISIFVATILACAPIARGGDVTVNASDLGTKVKIIGPLGKPLGEMITIECKTLPPNEQPRGKDSAGRFFVKVTAVDGVALKKPVVIEVRVFPFSPKPKRDGMDLEITGYQDGSFQGIPPAALNGVSPPPQTQSWHFAVYFQDMNENGLRGTR